MRFLRLILVAFVFAAGTTEARAQGYEVVGLLNSAVKLRTPATAEAYLWMGDRLNSEDTEFVRVDPEGRLVLQSGGPEGALFECAEYTMISVADRDRLNLWFGRMRIVNANQTDSPAVTLHTEYGTFIIPGRSLVEVDVQSRRMALFCLAGPVTVQTAEYPEGRAVGSGSVFQAGAQGKTAILPMPADLYASLQRRPPLPMRYRTEGAAPPRIRWFAPTPGERASRPEFDIRCRVDPEGGSVRAFYGKTALKPDPAGVIRTTARLTGATDSIVLRFEKSASAGSLTVLSGMDDRPPKLSVDPTGDTVDAGEILISGTLDEDAVVVIKGNPVHSRNRKFSKIVDLSPGINTLKLAAFDRTGNRSDLTLSVFSTAAATDRHLRQAEREVDTGVDRRPDTPAILQAESRAGGFFLRLGGRTGDGGSYRIYRSFSQDGPYLMVGETDEDEFLDATFASAGSGVIYRATALGALGEESPMSEPVRASLSKALAGGPAAVSYRREGGKLRIFWPRSDAVDISGYNVYRVDGDTTRVASLPGPPYIADLPETFAEIIFRIRAVSAFSLEEGEWSEPVVIRP